MINETSEKNWKVYIIQTQSGKFYTGITNNIDKRLAAHKNKKGARFFNISSADKILYQELHLNRSEATKREMAIKKMSRKEKLSLMGVK